MGEMFENLDNTNPYSILYYPLFMTRRIIQLILIFFVQDYPFLQV
jgi:hypothetical protein